VQHDCVPADSLLRLTVRVGANTRRWTILVDAASVAAAGDVFQLPTGIAKPFVDPGTFSMELEVVEFEAGKFAIDSLVLSDIEREQRRAARSATATQDTTPP
jgi:hypothetical protein